MTTEAATSQRPSRRRPGEVRELLVGAAREVFIDVGYQGASLRQIAAKAGTTQAVLYRYFPSKAQLFQESVLRPFEDLVVQLIEDWRSTSVSALSTRDLIAGFTDSLYDFSTTHRGLIVALLAADAHSDESISDAKTAFAQTISAVGRGWADIDVEVAAPATMAMIIATALLDHWLFPPAKRPDRARILAEMIRYEVRAITGDEAR